MRPVSSNRLPSPRTWLVLLVAFVLTVTGLPFALAGDDATTAASTDAAVEDGGAAAEPAPEATEDPIIIIPDEPASEAPVDEAPDEEPPATEPPAEPAPESEKPVDAPDDESAPTDVDTTTDEPALAPSRLDTQAEALAALAPDGGDFSIDWAASEPYSYSHVTGGGVYASGGNDTTVESLNGGDFRCGDLVSYLAAITVDNSGATDASTLQFTTTFATLTSSQSGIGHEDIIRAVINTGDPGMDGDASVVSLVESTSGEDLIGVITVDDLEAGEEIIVRVDVRLGCQNGGKNTGTIHAALDNVRVISPTNEVVPSGAQTIPFKQAGVRRELLVTKDVVGIQPAGATYTVEVTCLKGDTASLTFTGDGTQSAGQIPEGDTCTVTETDDGGADRTTVKVNAGAAQNGHTTDIVIGASNEVTFTNTYLEPTITVGKTATPATVTPEGTITYTITATNTAASPVAARDVVVTDDLDDDLADVAATYSVAGGAAQPCDDVGVGNTVRCAVGTLAIGQSVVVTVTARATIASCGDVLNRAGAAGSNFTVVRSPQVTVPVVCAPDINVEKTSSTANAVPDDDFTYTITTTNAATATAPATGVVVTDDLHDSLTGVSATFKVDGGAEQQCDPVGAGNTIRCAVGTLPIGSSAVVTIAATATPASCPSVANRAVVTGTNFPNESSGPVDVTVTCTPELTIDKTASKTSVVPGESWDYEITVASPSTATATSTGVVVTDNLHDGLVVARPTFSVNGGAAQQCDVVGAGNTIRCAVGDLAPGDSAVVTIAATATVASCGDVVNVALATAINIRDEVGSDPVTVEVVCASAPELDKTASTGTVLAGDDITYTITATNPSPAATATARNVVITDDLDDDLTDVGGFVTNGGTITVCSKAAGNVLTCNAGDIPIDGTAVLTVTATTTPLACGIVSNQSSADGANFTTVTSPRVDVTVICPPGMSIVKSASAGTVRPGDDYTYTITATNSAGADGSPGEDLVITDDLDDDLSDVSASYSIGGGASQACDPTGAGNTIRCAVGDLGMGASVDVTIEATATIAACGVVTNVSTATGTNFTTITSNEVDVDVECAPALELEKIAPLGPITAGDDMLYVISARNPAGPGGATAPARDVVITDNIDDTLTNVRATVRNGATTTDCAVGAGNLVTCDAGDIGVGGFAVVEITVTTTRLSCGSVRNVSTADGTNFTTVTSNFVDTTIECREPPPSISLVKTGATGGSAGVGDVITYTYVIKNTGPSTLTDITLRDDKLGVLTTPKTTLAPGESMVATATHIITEADLADGEIHNVGTTTGKPPEGPPVEDEDDATVEIDGIEVIKTATPDVVRAAGEVVTYEYLITNTGGSHLRDITLIDDKLGVIVSIDDMLSLAPKASTTVTKQYTITQADIDAGRPILNVAIVTGLPPNGLPITDEDDAIVEIIIVPPDSLLQVVKQLDGDGTPAPGAQFGFTVECDPSTPAPDYEFTIDADSVGDGVTVDVPEQLPVGATCTVTEARTAGAVSTTVTLDGSPTQSGTAVDVVDVQEGMLYTVTFVNTYEEREMIPPVSRERIPATGAPLMLQLVVGLGALGLGGGMVRLSASAGRRRRRKPASWSTRL